MTEKQKHAINKIINYLKDTLPRYEMVEIEREIETVEAMLNETYQNK